MWHYAARKRIEHGEVYFELVEVFPDLAKDIKDWDPTVLTEEPLHTENAVHVYGETKEELAHWLRVAADDVEKYDFIED